MSYVLLTAAYNEEKYIEKTIKSIISQTCLPKQWIIISDNSNDNTDHIVKKYKEKYSFITFLRLVNPEMETSNLGRVSKRIVACIKYGISYIVERYQYIGIIDADVAVEPQFFENLLNRFLVNEKLGLCGGFIYNVHNGNLFPYFTKKKQVGGPLQLFRKECWDEIGGLYPGGHHDYYAVASCRMKKWQVQSYADLCVYHHKNAVATGLNLFKVKFHLGCMDYVCGELFIYALARALLSVHKKPVIIGSIIRITGFIYSAISLIPKQIPEDLREYLRQEQLRKLSLGLFGR